MLFALLLTLKIGCLLSEELAVPYVPYVVVDKDKDEFDYDRLQKTIVDYLETRDVSTEANRKSGRIVQRQADTRMAQQIPQFKPLHLSYQPVTTLSSASYQIYETTPTVLPYYANEYNFTSGRFPVYSNEAMSSTSSSSINIGQYTLPLGTQMKCSLRSSRFVFDGDCVSKKPIVETVCADRCIKYEYEYNPPVHREHSQIIKKQKRPVTALTCTDSDVKKTKVKLYCKDGTIINNVIRIVNSCVCQEHGEKVHTTKQFARPAKSLRKRNLYQRKPPAYVRRRPF